MQDRLGQQFGNYRLLALIGRGGYAEVYLAEHIYLEHQHYAIKIVKRPDVQGDTQDEFLHEARIIANLQRFNEHIVRIQDVGIEIKREDREERYIPYIVMEYAREGTLRNRYPEGTQVPLERIVLYTNQIAGALQCAHDQKTPVIHRDVKPENMLLRSVDHVLLSDFGISIASKTGRLEQPPPTLGVIGTAPYIAPERIAGQTRRASDQYSLGIVVYEWISGNRPFTGTSAEICLKHLNVLPPALYPDCQHITPQISAVVARALAKKPEERYASVLDFAHALEEAVIEAHQEKEQKKILAPFPADRQQRRTSVFTPPPALPMTELEAGDTTQPFTTQQGRAIASPVQSMRVIQPALPWSFLTFSTRLTMDNGANFFVSGGIILNVCSTLMIGLLLRSPYALLGTLALAALLLTLCVAAVGEKLTLFFGVCLALYWGMVGWIAGYFLALRLHHTPVLPALFVGCVFAGASMGVHVWYAKRKEM